MSRKEIPLHVERVAGIAIGFAGFDAGAEYADLAFDLIKNWNPRIASAVTARIPKAAVRLAEGADVEGLLAALRNLHDREFATCDTIIQHGAFDMMRRSTGAVDKITVMLGVFCRSDETPVVVSGAGLDMTLVPGAPSAPSATADAAAEQLLRAIPRSEVSKLATLGERVRNLAVTAKSQALAELDANNAARRTVWGDQAVTIPVMASTADGVMYALLSCVADDFRLRQARSLEIEEVAALRTASLAEQLAARDDEIRKLVISVYFPGAFGTHEILRVADDEYVGMPCTFEPKATAAHTHGSTLHVPAPFPHGVEVPAPAEPPAWLTRGITAVKERPVRSVAYGCLTLAAASVLLSLLLALVSPKAPATIDETIPLSIKYAATIEGQQNLLGAFVDPTQVRDTRLRLVAGRFLVARDFELGAPPVVVVSERLVQSLFPGDREVVGRRVEVNGQATTIVGVIALRDPAHTLTDFWTPMK